MKLTDTHKYYSEQVFENLILTEQTFTDKEFDGCQFTHCNFSDSVFERCKFNECIFNHCNLSMLKLNKSAFNDTEFQESKLIGINWTLAHWPTIKLSSPIRFIKCILNDSCFLGLYLKELVILECKAHDVDLRDADCTQANFSHTDFTHSLFNRTNLSEADFSDASNYYIDVFANNIKQAKFTMPEAMNLLKGLDIDLVE